jgi:hypothetical protein
MPTADNHPERFLTVPLGIAVLAAAFVSGLAYHFILGCFFTGTDTLTLIETSRVHSLSDVIRLVSEPLMGTTEFIDVAKFYRPVTALSYSMDYALWNLRPVGFQLTNLLLHLIATGLVVVVMYELSGKDLAFAWLSGMIFTLHPIIVESVPATDRRQDMIAAVFILMSLTIFLRSRLTKARRGLLLALSLLSYGLALGGKEIAIIVPPLVFAHLWLTASTRRPFHRLGAAATGAAPYLWVTLLYLILRVHVLGGLGGYLHGYPQGWGGMLAYAMNMAHNYVVDLLYPVDIFGVMEGNFACWWSWILVCSLGLYVWAHFLSCGCRKSLEDRSSDGVLMGFLLVWLVLPFALFLCTLTFAHRSMYVPTIAMSGVLAYPLANSGRRLLRSLLLHSDSAASNVASGCTSLCKSRQAVVGMGAIVLCYLFAYSPLLNNYNHWADSANIACAVLNRLASEAEKSAQSISLHVYDLPDGITSYEKKAPRAREVTYLQDYSIKSWLNLLRSGACKEVIIHSRSRPWKFDGDLRLSVFHLGRRTLKAFVKLGPPARRASLTH